MSTLIEEGLEHSISPLQKARTKYQPKYPEILVSGELRVQKETATTLFKDEVDEIRKQFPQTMGLPLIHLGSEGDRSLDSGIRTVGVVLSGGPAPGGHNAILGLYTGLKAANPQSRLLGFLYGPKGVIYGDHIEINDRHIEHFLNTGGFDMIGTGRDKIESEEDINRCLDSLKRLKVDALVVIGGDDSNTNAAVLAEAFAQRKASIQVIGVPKTIDGDMKGGLIETSFGFDTACRSYAELVGNLCRDSLSSRKYYHFVKLMGRAASHVALEVALNVKPNLTIISEELAANRTTLAQVVDLITDVIVRRSRAGKNYGVIVIPEGLLEFLVDFQDLLKELNLLLKTEEAVVQSLHTLEDLRRFLGQKLTAESVRVYNELPNSIQRVLLDRDKHGNIRVSQIETEKLLIDLVGLRINEMKVQGNFKGSFEALPHFFGYEGRSIPPTNFDANYTFTLGLGAAALVRSGATGYTVFVENVAGPVESWTLGGVPVTSLLHMELRKGKMKPVIKKALVEVDGPVFRLFDAQRESWVVEDRFEFPGPIQYFGPDEVSGRPSLTVQIEADARSSA
jgi:pyrophosphate--fructose-6-phosphate 1-phosphotransferase